MVNRTASIGLNPHFFFYHSVAKGADPRGAYAVGEDFKPAPAGHWNGPNVKHVALYHYSKSK